MILYLLLVAAMRLMGKRQLGELQPSELVVTLLLSDLPAVPVLDKNTVIMEIKYGSAVPAFIRALTAVPCKQLSVSKYALSREQTR